MHKFLTVINKFCIFLCFFPGCGMIPIEIFVVDLLPGTDLVNIFIST